MESNHPNNLRAYREEKGLNTSELARLSSVSWLTIWLLENGRHVPRESTMLKLLKALDIPPERLKDVFPDDGVGAGCVVNSNHDTGPRPQNRLQHYREELMLSRNDLAELSGINRITIRDIETKNKRARISTRRELLKALGVPLEKMTDVFPE